MTQMNANGPVPNRWTVSVGRLAATFACLCVRSVLLARRDERWVSGGDSQRRAGAGGVGLGFGFGFAAGEDVADRKGLFEPFEVEAAGIAAEFSDGTLQFVPERMARWDTEVAADVGDDGADLLAPDFSGDLVRGGQPCEQRGCVDGLRLGLAPWRTRLGGGWKGARRAKRWLGLGLGVDLGRGAGDFFLEVTGPEQALGDAGEDDGDVTGTEVAGEVARVIGSGALAKGGGELLAIVDEFADEREEAAGTAWWGSVSGGSHIGHERRENTEGVSLSRYFS